ncbi:MAG: hypothetical protein LBV15_05450, partial [Planctomycetota bacterium]|nr:hypothetical protein [Planctomycetota bacterium]
NLNPAQILVETETQRAVVGRQPIVGIGQSLIQGGFAACLFFPEINGGGISFRRGDHPGGFRGSRGNCGGGIGFRIGIGEKDQ